jgi:hypothetical protein
MKVSSIFKYTLAKEKLIFFGAVFTAAYWVIGNTVNIYKYDFVGAIYELLSLFMLMFLFILPVLAIIFWFQGKFNLKTYSFVTLLILISTYLFLFSI